MKLYCNILLLICIFFVCTSLSAQLTIDQKSKIKSDIDFLYKDKLPKISNSDRAYYLLHRNDIRNEIAKAIKTNDSKLLSLFLTEYTAVLDTMVVSQPILANELLNKLSNYFSEDQSSLELLKYYLCASNYFSGLYKTAEIELLQLVKNSQNSKVVSDALTLLLKTSLISENYSTATQLIPTIKIPLTDEHKYYIGHIYYAINEDTLAVKFFSEITDLRYTSETNKLLKLLSAIKIQDATGVEELASLLLSNPNDPFILLALARIEANKSNLNNSDQHYSKYLIANKQHWESQLIFESAMLMVQKGNKTQAIEFLGKRFFDKPAVNYDQSLVFLWADLLANNNQIDVPVKWLKDSELKAVNNRSLILHKQSILNKIINIKNTIGGNSSLAQLNTAVDEIVIGIKTLDSLNTFIRSNPIGLSSNYIHKWLYFEKRIAINTILQLENFIATESLQDIQDTLHIERLNTLEKVYGEQLAQISKIRNSLIKLNDENKYLAIRNEIDSNLDVLDKLIINLAEMKKSGQSVYTQSQLDSLIIVNQRKRTETALLIDYYDFDNTLYKEILEECDSATKSTLQLMKQIPALKDEYIQKYPKYISKREKKSVIKELSETAIDTKEYDSFISEQIKQIDAFVFDTRFIDNYVAFVETTNYDKQKKMREVSLSFEENQALFRENQARKKTVYDRTYDYIINHKESIISNEYDYSNAVYDKLAIANFVLAELSSSITQDKPELTLEYYRNVLKKNSDFYHIDAVLYNIGFLSTLVTKERIETAKLNSEANITRSSVMIDNERLSEITLKEPIDAYTRIISEYSTSEYYKESMIRLGNLYFDIGTDADSPIEYYQKARNLYDKLIADTDSQFKYQALYQRGWTWLNSSTEEAYINAINDFSALLQAIDKQELTDNTEIVDFTVASIKNIGYCLIGLDGTATDEYSKGADYVTNVLKINLASKYVKPIIDEAIQQKLKLFLPMQVVDLLKVKIELDPLSIENPIIADSICTIYKMYPTSVKKGMSVEQVLADERMMIINDYSLDTPWYNANKSNNLSKQNSVIRQAFYDIEIRLNNDFIDTPSIESLKAYEHVIDQFSRYKTLHSKNDSLWIENKKANVIALHIKLADVLKTANQYIVTANRIYSYNDSHLGRVTYFDLEGKAYEIAEYLYVNNLTITPDSLTPNPQFPLNAKSLDDYYNLAINRFLSVLVKPQYRSPQNDNLYIAVASKQAEIAKDKRHFEQALSFYKQISEFDGVISNEIKRAVFINLAEISDSLNNYSEAEKYYKSASNFALNKNDKDMLHQYAMLQIQNSAENSTNKGNTSFAADEYLRLSSEYQMINPVVSTQYKAKAQVAYLAAKEYQKSISLLLDLASTRSKPNEVLDFYRLAWSIADSIKATTQSDTLKQSFIAKYPSSYEAYQLRLSIIDSKINMFGKQKEAGESYLDLYNDVVAKKINSGSDNPQDLYLAAIGLFAQVGDEARKEVLAEDFVKKYPNHISSLTLMEYLADRQLAKGDTISFEQMSKSLFAKDKTKASRYTNLAKDRLRKIATDFDKAYTDKDWVLAFSKRDDFKKIHSSYEKEGLLLDFSPVYKVFANAETEYKQLQERDNFIKSYHNQINNIVGAFIKKSPDDLLRVNPNTKWKKNLIAGDNRILTFKNVTSNEIKKIRVLLESGTKYELSVEDRLKAFDAICQINEHASSITKKQIDKYIQTSTEFKEFLQQFRGAEDELYAGFYSQRDGYALTFIQQAYPYYAVMYKNFYLAGLKNTYTNNAYKRLVSLDALPKYKLDELMIKDWTINIVDIDDSTKIQSFKSGFEPVVGNNNYKFNKLTIPGNCKLDISKNIDLKVPYEYILASVASPFVDETQVFVNKEQNDFSYNAIDSLKTSSSNQTRFALILGENKFVAGNNTINMQLFNYGTAPISVIVGFVAISDSVKIEAAIPIKTLSFDTDDTWQYGIVSAGKPVKDWKKAQKTADFNFTKQQLYEMEDTTAEPIWINASDVKDSLFIVFQKEFLIDGILKEGYIKFVAPDVASVKINDIELTKDFQLNYDEESELVFPGQISINPKDFSKGKNTLQILVHNKSKFKGIVAETKFVVAYPE